MPFLCILNTEEKYVIMNKIETLKVFLAPQKKVLKKAKEEVLVQDISNYPIFVLSEKEIELGIPLVKSALDDKNFSYIRMTTLEELATKGIVEMSKVDDFRALYKSKKDHFCLLIIRTDQPEFVFYPEGND